MHVNIITLIGVYEENHVKVKYNDQKGLKDCCRMSTGWLRRIDIVSWEPEGRYCRSKLFCWAPEGRYCHWLCTAIAPFWFSTELFSAIAPFWLSTDNISFLSLKWSQEVIHCLIFNMINSQLSFQPLGRNCLFCCAWWSREHREKAYNVEWNIRLLWPGGSLPLETVPYQHESPSEKQP